MKLIRTLLLGIFLTVSLCRAAPLPKPTAQQLPRWRGFNLLEKFYKGSQNGPYKEEDFRLIAELGFNFVRLPMDYRLWIKDNDWRQFDESIFVDLDQAVEYGQKYNIHVCLNFHRAPGYTVANPPEQKSLWTDPEAQEVCAMHWARFARHFKGIPNANLSFNLLNEPANIDADTYYAVVKQLAEAIRAEDPNRLIIADGLNWGSTPCDALLPLKVAQATRGYQPFGLTHYKANWVDGSDSWAMPQWPVPLAFGGYLYGPAKKDLRSPMLIEAAIDQPMQLRLRVGTVSTEATLTVTDNNQPIFSQAFHPGPGDGPWKQSSYKAEWKVYQNLYDRDYTVELSPGKHTLRIENASGDWLTLTRIAFEAPGGPVFTYPITPQWGQPNEPLQFTFKADSGQFSAEKSQDRQWHWDTHVRPWAAFGQSGGVMVGEWGAYNQTPHDVTLRWMEDCLKNYQQAGLGWALWNFRGSFGILDSVRSDVDYEDFRGHQLDRKMLDLLQQY
jgi:aryl-phospho-beta-D-glucosidase BglC (GH1 family)